MSAGCEAASSLSRNVVIVTNRLSSGVPFVCLFNEIRHVSLRIAIVASGSVYLHLT
jgi:hypothetical protein